MCDKTLNTVPHFGSDEIMIYYVYYVYIMYIMYSNIHRTVAKSDAVIVIVICIKCLKYTKLIFFSKGILFNCWLIC